MFEKLHKRADMIPSPFRHVILFAIPWLLLYLSGFIIFTTHKTIARGIFCFAILSASYAASYYYSRHLGISRRFLILSVIVGSIATGIVHSVSVRLSHSFAIGILSFFFVVWTEKIERFTLILVITIILGCVTAFVCSPRGIAGVWVAGTFFIASCANYFLLSPREKPL